MSGKRLRVVIAAALFALALALSAGSPTQVVPSVVLAAECESTACGGN